jgi:hypothetical protein
VLTEEKITCSEKELFPLNSALKIYLFPDFTPRRLEPTAVGGGVTARENVGGGGGLIHGSSFCGSQYTKEAVKVALHTGWSFCCDPWEYQRNDLLS